jgi:hypothetical protein
MLLTLWVTCQKKAAAVNPQEDVHTRHDEGGIRVVVPTAMQAGGLRKEEREFVREQVQMEYMICRWQ